jgi:hypothetical protein
MDNAESHMILTCLMKSGTGATTTTYTFLARMLRESPALALRLVQIIAREPPPAGATLEPIPTQVWDSRPRGYSQPEAAYLIKDAAGKLLSPLVLAVQLGPSPGKKDEWLHCTATLLARFRSLVTFVAVTLDRDTERWCAEPLVLDHGPSVFHPAVVGPSVIPRIVDIAQAKVMPELAVLSALAHARSPGAMAIAFAALAACETLDTDQGCRYADFLTDWLDDTSPAFLGESSHRARQP